MSSAVIVSVVSFTSTFGQRDDISAPYTVVRHAMADNDCFRMRKHGTTGGRFRAPWNGRLMRAEFKAGRNICG